MSFSYTKILVAIFLLLLLFLQCRLWFESGGIIDMMRMKKQLSTERAINEKLKKRNEHLILQVEHLQQNKEAIESRARHELGMIKKGETFYQVVK